MTRLLLIVLLCVPSLAAAQPETHSASLVTGGYQEAVFSVSSLEDYREFFENVAGWQVKAEGPLSDAQLRAWGLGGDASGHQLVLGNPGTPRGYVRLVKFAGVPQQQIRSNAQSWDTGGWFDVNARVLSMDQKFGEFQARNWQASSDPIQFSFGPFVVKEWLARGPDGVVMALIERVEPPLEGWPQLQQMSRIFNATQIVPDIEQARDFYMNKLGFTSYLEHHGASKAPGPNVLGMPHNVAAEVPRIVSIVHPQGKNEGSVELLQFDGLTGADWAERASPPNLGIVMLRFPVADLTAFYDHVRRQGIEVIAAPATIELKPYGTARVLAVRGPGGVWLEFFELLTQTADVGLEDHDG
ncbi:MAG: VOC family protein [Pseudomonadota bacterium]